jgi:hypothetical protein
MNYTLDGVSIHPVTTKIQAPFLTQLPERKETAPPSLTQSLLKLKRPGLSQ